MRELEVRGRARLCGRAVAPPDKSITHRALILAALGEGRAEIAPLGGGADNRATREVLAALGVPIRLEGGLEGGGAVAVVEGVGGPAGLRAPGRPLDCDNSGTTLRVMAGVLAAAPGLQVTLTGDESLCRRPMERLRPLEGMGARLSGVTREGRLCPPLEVRGAPLVGREHRLPVASAQVKTALLLAGLFADGETTVWEPHRSRDHTERLLGALGAPLSVEADGRIRVARRRAPWRAPRYVVPPDCSSAAFLVAAAALTGSWGVRVETGVNPTRTGFFDALSAMGIDLAFHPRPSAGPEPMAEVEVRGGSLRGVTVAGALTLRAIDELPLLAAVAACAEGTTVIRDAAELRVKESDRLHQTHRLLQAFGARSTETPDGLIIQGGAVHPAEVAAEGDHRLAMTAAVLGLAAEGTTRVRGAEVIDVSYPGFAAALAELGAVVALRSMEAAG